MNKLLVIDDEDDFMDLESFNAKYLNKCKQNELYDGSNSKDISLIPQNIRTLFNTPGLKNNSEKIIFTRNLNIDNFYFEENFENINVSRSGKNFKQDSSLSNNGFCTNLNSVNNAKLVFSLKKYLIRIINNLLNKKEIKKVFII
jgi:hypothetical protein